MLFRPACTDSAPSLSCFHISSVLISNGNQKMKSHSQSRDLPRRPAPLPPARLGLRAVQASRTTNLDSRFTNHESGFTHHPSVVTRPCPFLISSRPVLKIDPTRSQQKRKLFLIASFFAVLAREDYGARGLRGLLNYGLRSYGTQTGRRDCRIAKVRAPTIRAASIPYLA